MKTSNKINTFTIKAGKMLIESGKVKPLSTKGELTFFTNSDSNNTNIINK